jgi:hypothetical protein
VAARWNELLRHGAARGEPGTHAVRRERAPVGQLVDAQENVAAPASVAGLEDERERQRRVLVGPQEADRPRMRDRRRCEHSRRRQLVVGESQRERPVEHGQPAALEILELTAARLDPVERVAHVEPAEYRVGVVDGTSVGGREQEARHARRRGGRQAEVRG